MKKGILVSLVVCAMLVLVSAAFADTGNQELLAGETAVLDKVGFVAGLPVTGPLHVLDAKSAEGVAHVVGRTAWAPVRVTGKLVGAVMDPGNGDKWTEFLYDVGRTAVSPLTVVSHVTRGLLSSVGLSP